MALFPIRDTPYVRKPIPKEQYKRKSLLLSKRTNSNTPVSKRRKANRVGRPEKVTKKVKKQLAFSEEAGKLRSNKQFLMQYKRRSQIIRLSKANNF